MRNRLFIAASITLCLGLSGSSFAQTFKQETDVTLSSDENEFLGILNQFRQSLGLPSVRLSSSLQTAARLHSSDMAQNDLLTHYGPSRGYSPFQRMQDAGYSTFSYAGENIACGNKTALGTFKQWAFSEGHLRNMMSPNFTEIGIAQAGTGNENCPYYWTNDFASQSTETVVCENISNPSLVNQAIAAIIGISENEVASSRHGEN